LKIAAVFAIDFRASESSMEYGAQPLDSPALGVDDSVSPVLWYHSTG
jgi:hypothetical protein